MLNRIEAELEKLNHWLSLQDKESKEAVLNEQIQIRNSLEQLFVEFLKSLPGDHRNNVSLTTLNRELERAYTVIQKTGVVVFEWTQDQNLPALFVTDNIAQFGYTPEDFYSGDMKDYWAFVHPEDRDRAKETVYAMREKRTPDYRHQYRILCRDGSVRWVEENTLLETIEGDDNLYERGILYDVTEQVLMNEKLRGSEERYRTLFDKAPALMLTMNASGRITSANQFCQTFFQYREEELKRLSFKDLISTHTFDSRRFDNLIDLCNALKGTPVEVDVRTKDMRTCCLQLTLDLVRYDQNQLEIQAIAQDVTAKRAMDEKVRYLSYHDKLTGLFNRAWFDEKQKELELAGRIPYTVIIGDMNGLKVANDLFGHKTGDLLLSVTADILRRCCRETDVICRQGGDEFAILLPDAGEEIARDVCQRIRAACETTVMKPISPSIALGYATRKDFSQSIEDLMKEADDRMYRNKLNVSSSLRSALLVSLQASLEEKTMETKAHGERIQQLVCQLAQRMGLSESNLDELRIASVMHDIGKIGIPDSILTKPGRLSESEWDIMKKHCEIGHNILNTSSNMKSIGEYVLYHHERWDGSGYPHGLQGKEIPLGSRIISVVDAFDVMLHNRVYSVAKPIHEAVEELYRCQGTQFDPEVVAAFVEMIEETRISEEIL